MQLRPTPPFVREQFVATDTFRFLRDPILVRPETRPPQDGDSGEDTDPEDHESRIQTSWHHRAKLGDENRVKYTDFADTDFEAVNTKTELRNAQNATDEIVVVF